MAHFTLFWLLISPLVIALSWMLLAGRGLQRVKYLGAAALIATGGLLALLAAETATAPKALCLFTHPSAGAMCVLAEASSLRLSALLCLLLAALIAARVNTLALNPLQASFLFASLSAGCLALLAEHFLLRYIALELAAIWLLIELFLALQGDDAQMRSSISAFINLRVGDVGLLIAIFLMFSAGGSFIITDSLEAATQLDAGSQALAGTGLVLACWVKLGAWPLNGWARIGEGLHASLFSWFCRLLIPMLGGYLLYRSGVFIASIPGFGSVLLLAASVCALASALIRIFQTTYRDTILANQSYAACLLICLAGAGAGGQILPALAAFLIARLMIDLLRHTEQQFDAARRGRQTQWLLWARMLELMVFVPLVLHAAQNGPRGIWVFLLWIGFGLQFLLTAAKMDLYYLSLESGGQVLRPALRACGLVMLSAMGAWVLHHLSRLWLLSAHSAWQPLSIAQIIPWMPSMLGGVAAAGAILLGIKLAQNSPALAALARQAAVALSRLLSRDPLKSVQVSDVFDQYPRLMRSFGQFAGFLYDRVEHFTSVEVWRNVQAALFSAARRLQQLHTGKLRLNLVWMVLLLALLVVLYLWGRLDVIKAYG
jgi:hypothetical protein